ncbi:glycosyltransferase family 4 protein [Salinibaculum rarum]|uniref:glycosyltransferase family 4 protein n=1 Tax=Salinibaculum rarum TaxID=3058903 RepID=UPI0026602415|nr:glycosyltransferase family 4 protein [Salinibaculum sp. KK48]
MQILLVTSHFGAHENVGFMPLVGAELARRGHDVRGLQYEEGEVIDAFPIDRVSTRELYTPYWFGQWLFYRDWVPKVRSYISDVDPDIIVTDRRCMAPTLLAADDLGVPAVGVVPGLGFTRFDPWNLDERKTPSFLGAPFSVKIQYPFVQRLFQWHRQALAAASETVVISEFLQDVLHNTFDCDSTIVRTPVPLDDVRASSVDPKYLTVVNPRTTLKGSRLTARIAEHFPNYEFQIAGEFASKEDQQRIAGLNHVDHLGWVDNMQRVYENASLILVPSLVEEGGGPRVVIEGFANGIPAVGSDRGAIPEHINDAGRVVSNPMDMEEWRTAIEQALEHRDELSQQAYNAARQYDARDRVEEFERVLHRVIE